MRKYILVCIITTILLSFGLHAIQIEHAHGSDGGHAHSDQQSESPVTEWLGVHMHAVDKKNLLALLLILILGPSFLLSSVRIWSLLERASWSRCNVLRSKSGDITKCQADYLLQLFSQGVIHSKTH